MSMPARRPRRGFTMAEMLVVVAILTLLAVILTPVIFTAMGTVEQATVRTEISQIQQWLKANYTVGPPPDFSDQARVNAYWRKLFPRAKENPPSGLNQAEALWFWLQGFYSNPEYPLTNNGQQGTRASYDFALERLKPTANNRFVYLPRGLQAPYVYFDYRTYAASQFNAGTAGMGSGVARPDKHDSPVEGCANPKTFQIISAGVDENYGNMDNVTNFSSASTLEKSIPE